MGDQLQSSSLRIQNCKSVESVTTVLEEQAQAIIESLNFSGVSCRIRYGRHRPEQGRVNSTAYGVDWRTCGSRAPPSRAWGADALVQQNDGSTPLPGAFRPIQGHMESTHVRLEHGVHATARTDDGWTPLHFAAGRGQVVEFARLLLEHGADAIAQEKGGWTPLYVASKEGHPEVVRFLLEYGVDPTVKTEDGSLSLHVAAARGHVEVARLLLERGTDAKARKQDGSTPLHLAAAKGHVELIRVLLEHGADATAQTDEGQTPLDMASQQELVEQDQDDTVLECQALLLSPM